MIITLQPSLTGFKRAQTLTQDPVENIGYMIYFF